MYNDYFGLKEAPFSIAPNPQYLYMADRHREALAHLLYGVRSDGGFILLTGEVGTGKTTVCRCLLDQLPENVDVAFILNPKLTAVELLAAACDDLGICYPDNASIKTLVDKLNEFLLASLETGRRTVLIIDEAQNLSIDVLEQLRLLTNLETNQRKLLQIILIGQPELLSLIDQQALRQLSQRITARFHLDALRPEEIHEYIKHRLAVAGAKDTFFPNAVVKRIYKLSGGIPRVINLICDRALLGTYAENKRRVTRKIVNKAAVEVLGKTKKPWLKAKQYAAFSLIVIVFAMTLFYVEYFPVKEPSMSTNQPAIAVEPPSAVTPIKERSPRQPSLSNRLQTDPISMFEGHRAIDLAYTDLFTLWGLSFESQATPACELASGIKLMCFSDLGSLSDIENLNRPVILKINEQWFTLIRLMPDSGTLIADDRQFEVKRDELASAWDGHYFLLWEPPQGYTMPMRNGAKGDIIDLLALNLSKVTSAPLQMPTDQTFNNALERKVTLYQLSVDLFPDGIVGAKTWIHINSALGSNAPVLYQSSREN